MKKTTQASYCCTSTACTLQVVWTLRCDILHREYVKSNYEGKQLLEAVPELFSHLL